RVQFDWPVQGKIIRRYGNKRGLRSDGIDIAATPRTTVKAAANGKVIFSDWGPGEFGRTIIIRHRGGEFHSVYAHNAQNLVRKGDTVQRGAAIARVGRSGGTEMAMLHFQIRYRTKPRNPLSYLP
ncbi:MAG: peptidoglycan DD-metalloendopeptidase family protein, partial [bacterium]|nr:peptidoglycan DD-metalloendopeptidase family protein [bacterium]